MQYLQLNPESSTLPAISTLHPFRCVVIIEEAVTPEWQERVSSWLVKSGCLYMMAWGKKCHSWDESVMKANLKEFNGDIPDEKFTITTWHDGESLLETFWFAKHSAFHPQIEIRNTLLLHISNTSKMQDFLDKYTAV